MAILKRLLPAWLNLAPNSTASLDLPLGMSYHGIILKVSATGSGATFTRADIPRFRALLNGKPFIRDIPASILHRDNLFRGSRDDPAFLYLDFEEPRSKTMEDQYTTVIHTAQGVNSFKLEMDIANTAVGTLKIETVAIMANTGLPLGPVPAFIREGVDAVATGIKEIKPSFQVGAQGPGHILRCVHIFPSQLGTEVAPSFVIGGLGVTLRKSGIPVIDRLTDSINRYYQHHYEDVPIANAFTIDFVEDSNVGVNLMPTADATDMVWEVDISAACHLDFYYRMVTTLERL
jgi:hypothetical protein